MNTQIWNKGNAAMDQNACRVTRRPASLHGAHTTDQVETHAWTQAIIAAVTVGALLHLLQILFVTLAHTLI